MDIINWIEEKLRPKLCTSEEFIYNEMDSQSGYSLPIIYQPFDGIKKSHWADRGSLFDYLYTINGEEKTLLDFGPGDGWPSLIIAPYVKKVIGLDSSIRRVEICTENARRLGITNAKFLNYSAGTALPFEENSFDGIMAASSIEQTPNPKATLKELFRVLKPGGRLRIDYEAMSRYRAGREKDVWIAKLNDDLCKLILYIRNIKEEYAIQYGLNIAMSKNEVIKLLSQEEKVISFDKINISFLEQIYSKILDTRICRLVHPSGNTLVSWLKEIGFEEIIPSYSGAVAALKLYDQYSETERPRDIKLIDEVIKTVVKVVVQLRAPIEIDPMITAIK